MAKTASQIVDRTLTLIDEVVTEFETAATTETSIRNIALEILPEVCRDLIKELPWELKRYLSTNANLTADELIDGEDQSSYFKQKVAFKAPSDFWELVAFRMKVWVKPVTEYILINDESYPRQNNPFTRSGKQSPVVALSNSEGAIARIECFSVNNGDSKEVDVFEYVSFDNVPDDSGKTWPDEVFDEITKALAAELHIIKGKLNEASVKGEEITNALEQHE